MTRVVVGLDVRISETPASASRDGLNGERRGNTVRDDVARGHVDEFLVEIVLESDEALVELRNNVEEALPVVHDLLDGNTGETDIEV